MDLCFWYYLVWHCLHHIVLSWQKRLMRSTGMWAIQLSLFEFCTNWISKEWVANAVALTLYSRIQFLYSKCHKFHRHSQIIIVSYYDERWPILRSRERWWVRATYADSNTKMGEGIFCIMIGCLLPLLCTPALFSSRDRGDTLAAH